MDEDEFLLTYGVDLDGHQSAPYPPRYRGNPDYFDWDNFSNLSERDKVRVLRYYDTLDEDKRGRITRRFKNSWTPDQDVQVTGRLAKGEKSFEGLLGPEPLKTPSRA